MRLSGTISAVRSNTVQVPHVMSQEGGRVTLLRLVPNGTKVQDGDLLAEFDGTKFSDAARDAKAKFEDLSYQVKQRQALARSEAEKRQADVQQAEADLAKALIQLKKGPVLNQVERLQNEERAATLPLRVSSLKKVHTLRTQADQAAVKILELQRDRQKVALERAETSLANLTVKANYTGMVALQMVWRNGAMGAPQEGDRLWNGQPLLKVFDPGEMEVAVRVGEPDAVMLKPGAQARVLLDAYPGVSFPARFHSASPVATSALGSPIKNFNARFVLEGSDPRLLPDLSAAVVMSLEARQ
jgi:HlyD family secretion protein